MDKEIQEYHGYIYCITNNVNSKIYIGQTKMSIEERYASHIRCSRTKNGDNCLLYLAMRKYGVKNFSVSLVECVREESVDDLQKRLNELEVFYIKDFNSLKPNGYNMTPGGNAPPPSDRIAVVKLSKSGDVLAEYSSIIDASQQNSINASNIRHALNSNSHYSHGFYWHKKCDVLSVVSDGNIGLQERFDITPVYCFTLDGELVKMYESISDARKELNVPQGKISDVCRGRRKSTGGYLWSYTATPPIYDPKNLTCKRKPVLQMALDGTPINIYESATKAAKDLKLQSSLITACCNGKRKSTGGYRWAFSM